MNSEFSPEASTDIVGLEAALAEDVVSVIHSYTDNDVVEVWSFTVHNGLIIPGCLATTEDSKQPGWYEEGDHLEVLHPGEAVRVFRSKWKRYETYPQLEPEAHIVINNAGLAEVLKDTRRNRKKLAKAKVTVKQSRAD